MPISTAPPPPKNTRTPKPAAPSRTDKQTERSEGLQGYAAIGQAVLIGVRQYADAGAIGIHFPKLADEVAKLAATDERVAGWIDPIIQAGPATAVIAAALPLVMQFAVNHGWMKPGGMGTVSRETLSSKVELGIAQMQAQAYREQLAAEEESARIREEIQKLHTTIPGSAAA